MAITHAVVAMSATPAPLVNVTDSTDFVGRSVKGVIHVQPTAETYFGGPDTTTNNYGIRLAANERMTIELRDGDQLYARVAATTVGASVRVLYTGF